MFSGDLLFAGSIGRTDLPGGDHAAMRRSLARVCLTLPDETQVLPGHGPQTTIGEERASNQFLVGLTPGSRPDRPARRRPGRPRPGHRTVTDCEQRDGEAGRPMIRTHEAGTLRVSHVGASVVAGRLGGPSA